MDLQGGALWGGKKQSGADLSVMTNGETFEPGSADGGGGGWGGAEAAAS